MHSLFSRRRALQSLACGFGYLAFRDLAHAANPLATKTPHHKAKAKRIVFIFMQGGPSHVDTFDYKPRLTRDDGQMMRFDDARTFARDRSVVEHRVMRNLWPFRRHGQSGKWVSSLFPHTPHPADATLFLQGIHTHG